MRERKEKVMKLSQDARNRLLDELRYRGPGFAKLVAPLYVALGWTWGGDGGKVPTELDIAEHVEKTIQDMKKDDSVAHESGGIRIELEEDSEVWCAHLMFIYETTAYDLEPTP
jgi:hypothetical protein